MPDQPDEPLLLELHQPVAPQSPALACDAIYRRGLLCCETPLDLPDGTPVAVQVVLPSHAGPYVFDSRYEHGALRPLQPLDLPDGTALRLYFTLQVSVLALPGRNAGAGLGAAPALARRRNDSPARQSLAAGLLSSLALTRSDNLVLALVMLVYAITRFVGLVAYPIFFFCDEAIQTNLADSLLRHGLTDENGVFLPPFFRNVDKWNMSLSVYIQAIGLMLFGKSVFVNRATSVVVSMLGVIAVALTLRLIFRTRLWWAGALAMSALPVWFLHSRTSFETVMMVSFFACFLCSYLTYRYYDRRYLVAAIACGAATFYSYSNGQGVMLVSTVLLALSDARYHLETLAGLHRRPRLLAALVAITILAIGPYLRQRALYPFSTSDHLIAMNSIVTRNIPLGEKLGLFWKEYLTGLSPLYWFAPDNGIDLERHTMKGWGNLPRVFFPFVLVGLWTCVRQWRSPAHRAVLIAILAAPFAAALVFIHNYRALAMVVPAAILTGLGIERIGAWLAGFVRAVPVALATAVLLVAMNGVLLYDALANGPTWYRDYGLFGMQYGASQVFPLIAEDLEREPETEVLVSHSWANFPDAFIPFFVPENQRGRVTTATITDYLSERREIRPNQLFVLSAQEYDAGVASGKLQFDTPRRIVPYPDGTPGFYFVQFQYVPEIDAILQQEREERRQLVDDTVELDGQQVRVRHSKTDLGSPADLFDGNLETPLRGVDSNPFVLEFAFDTPRTLRGIELHPWPMTLDLTVIVTPSDGGPPRSYTRHYADLARDSLVEFMLPDGPLDVNAVRLELRDSVAGQIAKIHIPELRLR